MNARKQVSDIGWALTAFYLISSGLQFLYGAVLDRFGYLLPDFVWSEDCFMIAAQIIMYGIAFPVFCLLMGRIPSWYKEEKQCISFGRFLLALILCLGMAYIGNIIGQGMMLISDLMSGADSINPVTGAIMNMSPVMMFLSTVIAAPIVEELMFRKFLIDRLVPFGQKTAVVISGLAFGMFHGNFYQFFYAFSLGMIFAYLYSYTGKILYNILLHMGINLIGGMVPLILQLGMDQGSLLAWLGLSLLGFFMIVSIVAAIVILCIYVGRLSWFLAWKRSERGIAVSLITAPGVWAFFVVCMIEFLFAMGIF